MMAFILGIGLKRLDRVAWRSGKLSGQVIVVLLCLAAVWIAFLVFHRTLGSFYRIAHQAGAESDGLCVSPVATRLLVVGFRRRASRRCCRW
jgi:Na+/glutamate symporter